MEGTTLPEVALRAGVPESFVERLVELGIVGPGEDGAFSQGDLHRIRLMRSTDRAGVPLESVAAAIKAGRFSLAFMEMQHYRWAAVTDKTYEQVAVESGIPVPDLLAFEEALGIERPEPTAPVREDLMTMLPVVQAAYAAGIDQEAGLRATRVFADSLRRVAEAEAYMFHSQIEMPMLARGFTHQQMQEMSNAYGAATTPAQEQLLLAIYRRQQEAVWTAHSIEHMEEAMEEMGLYRRPERPPAIAFLDLTGYTRLTEERGDEAAAKLAAEMSGLVQITALRNGGRPVKWLGDGVMFFFAEPRGAVSATLDLVDAAPEVGLPAHAGVAAGPVILQDGDYYGRTVNMAARLSGRAEAGRTLVNDEVARLAAGDSLRFQDVGEMELKGFPKPVLVFEAIHAVEGAAEGMSAV